MRKLTKIIGVALIATGLMVLVTGCADPNSGLAELQAENERLEKENKELQKQFADLTAAKNILDEKFKDLKDPTPKQIAKLKNAQEEYDALIANLKELSKDFDDGKIDGQEYSKELEGIIGELKSLDAIISELSNKNKELDDALKAEKDAKDKLQKQLDDLSASLDSIIETEADTSLEDKIQKISEEIANLNAKLKENKENAVDTTEYETKIAELTARVNELLEENEQLKEDNAKITITFKVYKGDENTPAKAFYANAFETSYKISKSVKGSEILAKYPITTTGAELNDTLAGIAFNSDGSIVTAFASIKSAIANTDYKYYSPILAIKVKSKGIICEITNDTLFSSNDEIMIIVDSSIYLR